MRLAAGHDVEDAMVYAFERKVEASRMRRVAEAEIELVCAERGESRYATVYLDDFLDSAVIPDLVYANDAEKGQDYVCLYCGETVRIFDWYGGRYFRHMVKRDCSFPHRVVTLSTEV
ncbi:MAG: hypothetical protein F4X14_04730 [Caldilineaceae bacterium SB0661_bin_32]|uniref:Uncharacterized protein n=1 Tax=Caldilineaceae bacterium SB0661_bin_32 TaxID=2605255 RepID=A0A6B1D445_9CHLR|nr:hypothetical protein [Caldilineaceae bacterium SB0661_bin_32]